MSDNYSRPGNNRRAYWEFGKQISDGVKRGEVVRDMLDRLNDKYQGTDFKPVNEGTASKLKTAYELYVVKYGFSMKSLENISALDLYQARGKLQGVQMVNSRDDAEKLINRLKAGEKFHNIRDSFGASSKTRHEHLIEDVHNRILLLKTSNRTALKEVKELTKSYTTKIKAERNQPLKAEQLFLEYVIELAQLHIES